jgi:ABC-2 type transport system permease protein
VLPGGVFCVAAGAFTATVSRSVEGVQYTVAPPLLAAAVAADLPSGGALAAPLGGALLLVPGVPIADIVQHDWSGSGTVGAVAGLPGPVVGLVLPALWTAVAVLGAAARRQWTPRG